jgi:hypothetical protein
MEQGFRILKGGFSCLWFLSNDYVEAEPSTFIARTKHQLINSDDLNTIAESAGWFAASERASRLTPEGTAEHLGVMIRTGHAGRLSLGTDWASPVINEAAAGRVRTPSC